MSALAYLTVERSLRIVDARGDRPLSGDVGNISFGSWSAPKTAADSHSWPTFAPSGTYLASFCVPSGASDARLVVSGLDGVTVEELAVLEGRLPIYMQWSPDEERIALLTQEKDELVLSVVDRSQMGQEERLLVGSPMFFTWWQERVAVFAGQANGAQLALIGDDGQRRLPRIPGNFCAPVPFGDRLVYVARERGAGARLVSTDLAGSLEEIRPVQGLAALIRSYDGRSLAMATAEGENAPYRDLRVLDLASGEERVLSDDPCMAFVWRPDGTGLVRARVDTARNTLHWEEVDLDGDVRPLMELHPTRDMGFYLRFFEQYCQSHPIVDPTSQRLLVSGARPGDANGRPRIWSVPLEGGEPEGVADGMFAVFAWGSVRGG